MTDDHEKLLNVFHRRRTIRKFSDKPVKEADVRKIVEVGQRAPTGGNFQTYTIIWIKDPDYKQFNNYYTIIT